MIRRRFLQSTWMGGLAVAAVTLAGTAGCNITVTPGRAVLYAPAPVYVAPAPVYVAPAPVAVTPPPQVDPAIQQLVAPIALYPDPLLAQLLPAATFPQQIQAASAFVASNPNPDQPAIDAQPWDASVKAIVHYPTVLAYMNNNIQWTTDLGGAFSANQSEVMEAVQDMRSAAADKGNLVDTPQQTVVQTNGMIMIEPAVYGSIYVPVYDPAVVFYTPHVGLVFGDAFVGGVWLGADFDWFHYGVVLGPWHDWRVDWVGGPGHWGFGPHWHAGFHAWHRDGRWGGAPHFDRARFRAAHRNFRPVAHAEAHRAEQRRQEATRRQQQQRAGQRNAAQRNAGQRGGEQKRGGEEDHH